MLAKILAHGSTREEARARLVRAVLDARVVIEGGMTNKGFLLDVLDHPDFRAGGVTTSLARRRSGSRDATEPVVEALLVAAIHQYQKGRAAARSNFFAEASRGRPIHVPAVERRRGRSRVRGACVPPSRVRARRLGVPHPPRHARDAGHLARAGAVRAAAHHAQAARCRCSSARRTSRSASTSAARQHRVECDVGGRVRAPAPSLAHRRRP